MKSEEAIRNRRNALRSLISGSMKSGVLTVDSRMLTDLDVLNWVLDEEKEEE